MKNCLLDEKFYISIKKEKLIEKILESFEKREILSWIDKDGNKKEILDYDFYVKIGLLTASCTNYDVDIELFDWYMKNQNFENLEALVYFLHIYWRKKENIFSKGVEILSDIILDVTKNSYLYLGIMYLFLFILQKKSTILSKELNKKIIKILHNEKDIINENKNMLIIRLFKEIKKKYKI